MKKMERAGPLTPVLILLVLMITHGCSPPPDERDQRLADLAERMTEQQARQNENMAEQSKAVVEESGKVADAARELVEKDAEARREMIVASKEHNQDINAERASVDRQKEDLEQERREIAAARNRDPIVAESIKVIGLVLACLAPMLLAAYVLYTLRRTAGDDSAVVGELLVQEIASGRSELLAAPSRPLLEHDAPAAAIASDEGPDADGDGNLSENNSP